MLRRLRVPLAILALSATLHLNTTRAAELAWRGWLGGGPRDGWVDTFQTPAAWPDKLQQRWQVEVGSGYGSPVLADGLVYQHARQGEDEVVRCINLKTGAVKWQQSYPVPFKIGGGGERHGKGPKSSPALADGRLFTVSITGVLFAWDAKSGDLLWKRDYGDRFDKRHLYWGATTSPLVHQNHVMVHFGFDDAGVLVALDVASGKEVWSYGKAGPSYASPLLIELHGFRQLVELNMEGLVSVDAQTGRLLWKYPYPQIDSDQNMVTPSYYQGLILLGGENRGIRGLAPILQEDDWVIEERWQQDKVALDMSTAVINKDFLFGFSHYGRGRLFCLEPRTGKIRWQGPGRTGNNVTFLSFPGHVAALVNKGQLQILAAQGEQYERVASYGVSETPTWAPPVLVENGVLIKDEQRLTLWSFSPSSVAGQGTP